MRTGNHITIGTIGHRGQGVGSTSIDEQPSVSSASVGLNRAMCIDTSHCGDEVFRGAGTSGNVDSLTRPVRRLRAGLTPHQVTDGTYHWSSTQPALDDYHGLRGAQSSERPSLVRDEGDKPVADAEFQYLIDKVTEADFTNTPFKHIEIRSFFSDAHFEAVTSAPEICIDPSHDDSALCASLSEAGWEPIEFPGVTTSVKDYLAWREGKSGFKNVDTCEGFGMVYRLAQPQTEVICRLNDFLRSKEFLGALADKFEIDESAITSDVGIQKYLDGYEISPHPDIRTKALTFMVNINPHPDSESLNHHTHYLSFNEQWRYVEEFWRHNPQVDRSWVPWSWCRTVKQQTENNSIVIFSPSCDTMHAVRAKYDHLKGQRTQLYGNLWYGGGRHRDLPQISWQGLQLDTRRGTQNVITELPIKQRIKTVAKKVLNR